MVRSQRKLQACLCRGACVEVDSNTEAVEKKGFKLGCISCKKRGEVPASAFVDWYFKEKVDHNFTHVYRYENKEANITDERFFERLVWNGSKHTNDLQDGSIFILNVTFNDTGRYKCIFSRTLMYPAYEFSTFPNKTIDMTVEDFSGWRRKALRESAPEYLAIASESKDNCAAVQVAE
ncbi:hypothetical protein KUCAC02_013801 [Chaenocephalus aceratus]|uniref:Uncharacterized protein n=1 Tax=Chaenocephalus aceratus TaxID=36190 RepID=A0ACB9WCJ6_CHAAC|nr:hypothetical protein KUCAC02_013801 [Chaenocephalus aceratus]